jgi:preprotein translocase subunit SecE
MMMDRETKQNLIWTLGTVAGLALVFVAIAYGFGWFGGAPLPQ